MPCWCVVCTQQPKGQQHTGSAVRQHCVLTRVWVTAGALAELSTTLQQNIAEYVPKVLPILFRELRCEDGGNRRNAAFCAGVFCQYAPEQMQAQLGQLLQVLHLACHN